MKVNLAFYPARITMPQACSNCVTNPVSGYDQEDVMEYTDWSGKRWRTWTFTIPYCQLCLATLQKKTFFKGKAKSVKVSNVETKKYGGLIHKKKIAYVTFDFTNSGYARLFAEANKDILLENIMTR